jgi:hypothetical protein
LLGGFGGSGGDWVTPSGPDNGQHRRDEIEAWWALVSRILAFVLGAIILLYETALDPGRTQILILVAAGLMGPMVAAGVAQVIQAMRGGAPPYRQDDRDDDYRDRRK